MWLILRKTYIRNVYTNCILCVIIKLSNQGVMDLKKLKVYKENGEFVVERNNEFNHATKRSFLTEDGLLEGLEAYTNVLDDYEVEVSKELWAKVINFLGRGDKHE